MNMFVLMMLVCLYMDLYFQLVLLWLCCVELCVIMGVIMCCSGIRYWQFIVFRLMMRIVSCSQIGICSISEISRLVQMIIVVNVLRCMKCCIVVCFCWVFVKCSRKWLFRQLLMMLLMMLLVMVVQLLVGIRCSWLVVVVSEFMVVLFVVLMLFRFSLLLFMLILVLSRIVVLVVLGVVISIIEIIVVVNVVLGVLLCVNLLKCCSRLLCISVWVCDRCLCIVVLLSLSRLVICCECWFFWQYSSSILWLFVGRVEMIFLVVIFFFICCRWLVVFGVGLVVMFIVILVVLLVSGCLCWVCSQLWVRLWVICCSQGRKLVVLCSWCSCCQFFIKVFWVMFLLVWWLWVMVSVMVVIVFWQVSMMWLQVCW